MAFKNFYDYKLKTIRESIGFEVDLMTLKVKLDQRRKCVP